jgi:hypothetical protein
MVGLTVYLFGYYHAEVPGMCEHIRLLRPFLCREDFFNCDKGFVMLLHAQTDE